LANLLHKKGCQLLHLLDVVPSLFSLIVFGYLLMQDIKLCLDQQGFSQIRFHLLQRLIQRIAKKYSVAILVIHHTRKSESDDYIDTASGTLGIVGSFDGAIFLKRTRGECDGTLSVTGRDIEQESEYAMSFDKETKVWEVVGDAHFHAVSAERKQIMDIIRRYVETEGVGITVKDIFFSMPNKTEDSIRKMLQRMKKDEQVDNNGNRWELMDENPFLET